MSTSNGIQAKTESGLGRLLSHAYFLEKVLKHLVPDGVQECRRVCKQWGQICDALPLSLSIILHFEPPVSDFHSAFPNATSVSLSGVLEYRKFEKTQEKDAPTFQEQTMDQLLSLKHLQHLTWTTQGNWLFADPILERFSRLSHLQSFQLEFYGWGPSHYDHFEFEKFFTTSLCHMTQLTSLTLLLYGYGDNRAAPIMHLTGLKTLSVSLDFLINLEDQLMFPLQGLTALSVIGSNPQCHATPNLPNGLLHVPQVCFRKLTCV